MNNTKRTAIYFAYEGRNNNPNGDPASENKPRVYNQKYVYVTDVSSKRDDRDYLNLILPESIFLKQQLKDDGSAKQMDDLIKDALHDKKNLTHKGKANYFINRFIDIKYFGATLTGKIKEEKKGKKGKEGSAEQIGIDFNEGENKEKEDTETIKESICGPIQKTFGMSLNYPEIIPVKITTVLATRAQSSATGSMGTKYICDYYHIHYDIIINPYSLQEWDSQLTEEDIKVFEAVQWFSIKNDITHSKINREPIVMLEIIFKDPDYYFLPSNYVTAKNPKGKSYNEINVDYTKLIEHINFNAEHIEKVRYISNPAFSKDMTLIEEIKNISKEEIKLISREEILKHLETYKNYRP